MIKDEVTELICNIRHGIMTASMNYELWWTYRSSDNRERFTRAMNEYGPVFQTAINAHFLSTVVCLYRLFETRQDTANITRLGAILLEQELISEQVRDDFVAFVDAEVKPIWQKVAILRSNAFAHDSLKLSNEDAFKVAEITPDQIGELVFVTKVAFEKLTYAVDGSSNAYPEASHAGERLLSDLQEIFDQRYTARGT
ncbi:hypothetical protein EYC98_18640 [Halieaceae bacterium IMCC14734]|uniref:HEPN AbiU2-like domain-containing protein n=1 Tax=Candidatus Litorirhabdus singularis TaxID=2518993 RepID=A0ABT3TKQ3_9GAMM|nr:hypothetical protein [Candidatus Litorirhabdus singularis]MCX2982885.1 hypothetical protein [Candidatus Litorirhabdus singularis]